MDTERRTRHLLWAFILIFLIITLFVGYKWITTPKKISEQEKKDLKNVDNSLSGQIGEGAPIPPELPPLEESQGRKTAETPSEQGSIPIPPELPPLEESQGEKTTEQSEPTGAPIPPELPPLG